MFRDAYNRSFSKIQLSDEKKEALMALEVKKQRGRNPARALIACCLCAAVAVGILLESPIVENLPILDKEPSATEGAANATSGHFKIMQVYAADNSKTRIDKKDIVTSKPFYRIQRKKVTWDEADAIINNTEQTKDGNNISHQFYPFSYDTEHSDGYLVTTFYNSYFDVEGENIVSLTIASAKHNGLLCIFQENSNYAHDYAEPNNGMDIYEKKEEMTLYAEDLQRPHKIMWNPGEQGRELLTKESFQYSDLDDVLTFTVVFKKDGAEVTESCAIRLSFNDEGVMYTSLAD